MTAQTLDVAEPLREALRRVHRLVVHRRPWSEIAAALDAAAQLADETAAELVARERLEALVRCAAADVSDEDVERVLVATAAARATMDESDWLLERAVAGRPALAARHGATATEIVEARIERRIPVEVAEAIRYGHALRRMGWGHEEVFHVLGEAETLPAAAAYLSVLAFDRIMVGHMYELPEDLMEDAIQHAIPAHAGHPPWLLLGALMTATRRHPALAARYLPAAIVAAEDDLRVRPNVEGAGVLEDARRALERARSS